MGCGWVRAIPFFPRRQGEPEQHDGHLVPAGAEGTARRTRLHHSPTGGLQGGPGGLHAALHLLQAGPPPLTARRPSCWCLQRESSTSTDFFLLFLFLFLGAHFKV